MDRCCSNTADQMNNLRAAKKELRRVTRQGLSHIPDSSIHRQSCAAQETLLALPEYQAAKRISIYVSMPKGELSTRSLVLDALKRGKEVFIPYIYKVSAPQLGAPASVMDMVSLLSAEDFKALESDSWGIPTPNETSLVGRKRCLEDHDHELDGAQKNGRGFEGVDIMVMPGVTFDRRLARLGHGKGYYDFFLARYQHLLEVSFGPKGKMPFLVGLALEEQLLPTGQEIPVGTSDWRLDALIAGEQPVFRRNLGGPGGDS
ncbi:MAG: hypothetical protein Q9222_001807 [Ikaeria aurantiellina]